MPTALRSPENARIVAKVGPPPASLTESDFQALAAEAERPGVAAVPVGSEGAVSAALALLVEGLAPFVEGRLVRVHRDRWKSIARLSMKGRGRGDFRWDAYSVLTVLWDQWNSLFRNDLGHAERSLVAELKSFRNQWAHQKSLDFDDTYRLVDSVRRLLRAVGAPNLAAVERLREELLESHVAEAVNSQLTMKAFSRNRVRNIGLYAMCCVVIGIQMAAARPDGPVGVVVTGMVSVVLLTFCYLIYQQYRADPPLLYGPHECPRCRKIVYRKTCPYCG